MLIMRPIIPIIVRTGLQGCADITSSEAPFRVLRRGSAVRTGAIAARRGLLLAVLGLDLAGGRRFDFVLLAFVAMDSSGGRLRGLKVLSQKKGAVRRGAPLCFISS